jgi:hypothetical protein
MREKKLGLTISQWVGVLGLLIVCLGFIASDRADVSKDIEDIKIQQAKHDEFIKQYQIDRQENKDDHKEIMKTLHILIRKQK